MGNAGSNDGGQDDLNIGEDAMVEHYFPPTFPITPMVTPAVVEVCRRSWVSIKEKQISGTTGVVFFYDQFYNRLYERTKAFEVIFDGSLKKKGKVLAAAMEFVTTIDAVDIVGTSRRIREVGKMHCRTKGAMQKIRPWMYSVYLETLITAVSFCLGKEATFVVVDAWVNLLAYVLREMLGPAITGRIDVFEASTNDMTTVQMRASPKNA